jgi:hypothetical protein
MTDGEKPNNVLATIAGLHTEFAQRVSKSQVQENKYRGRIGQ